MSILEKLFDGAYESPQVKQDRPAALRAQDLAFWGQIQETMGVEFVENNWDYLCETERFTNFSNFRAGFRLGALLMLDLLEAER